MKILCYDDYVKELISAGFSIGGGNNEGIFSLIPWNWNEPAPYDTPVSWHTGDKETDPWEWRMRVLEERNDIAYGKIFFKKSGFITKEWYPYFLAARRGNLTLDEEYDHGKISIEAKSIYEVIESGATPLHAIKKLCGISKENTSKFERAIVELQMKLYITICGRRQKLSRIGEEYGWSSTVFCTTESFWGDEVFNSARAISKDDAVQKITEQVYILNPNADPKKVTKFISKA